MINSKKFRHRHVLKKKDMHELRESEIDRFY